MCARPCVLRWSKSTLDMNAQSKKMSITIAARQSIGCPCGASFGSCKTVIVVCRSLYVSMLNSLPCFACAEQREQPSQAVIGVRTEPAGHVGASENAKLPAGKAAAAVRPQRPRAGGSAWPENDVSARKTFSFAHKGCAASLAGCLIDMNPPPELCSSV